MTGRSDRVRARGGRTTGARSRCAVPTLPNRDLFVSSVTNQVNVLVLALTRLAEAGDGCVGLQRRIRFSTSLPTPPADLNWPYVARGSYYHCGADPVTTSAAEPTSSRS